MSNKIKAVFDCGRAGKITWEAPDDTVRAASGKDAGHQLQQAYGSMFRQLALTIYAGERLDKQGAQAVRDSLIAGVQSALRQAAGRIGRL